jgi:para-aminobenzoate synthetase component 1
LLKDAFPGGSITGAPKIRAMEIIEELEPIARSLYCGSIGYIDYHGNMDTSIAIRSSYRHHHKLYYHAGGGIITDSNAEDEYKELHHKASFFLDFCRNYQKQQN